jgi:hypothetical protein
MTPAARTNRHSFSATARVGEPRFGQPTQERFGLRSYRERRSIRCGRAIGSILPLHAELCNTQ